MKNELLSALFGSPLAEAARPRAFKRTLPAQTNSYPLKPHRVIRVERKQQFKKLEVRSGVIWLTGTPANGDLILAEGETFEFQNHWPYIIEAIQATEIFLS